jgi:hypothetical protein
MSPLSTETKMPRAEIASKQAAYTLGLLHAELAGKLLENKRAAVKIRTSMMQVEAVLKMLRPDFNIALIAPKRRVVGNPWFKRGTLFRCGRDAAGWCADDGAADHGCLDSRQGAYGDPQAGHRRTGRDPRVDAEAEWCDGSWRGSAGAVASDWRGIGVQRANEGGR